MSTLARLLSVQVQYQHDNVVHQGVREIQAACMKAVTKKEWKRKKRYLTDVQFSTDKKLATTQDRQKLQNSDEKQDCQYWILRLVVLLDFPHREIPCWNSIC